MLNGVMLELYVPEIVNIVMDGVVLVSCSDTVPAFAAGALARQAIKPAIITTNNLRIKPPYFSFPTTGNTSLFEQSCCSGLAHCNSLSIPISRKHAVYTLLSAPRLQNYAVPFLQDTLLSLPITE